MNSKPNDQTLGPSEKPTELFVQACTVEILIHLAILGLAVLPIVLLVFPVTVGALLVNMVVNAASGVFPNLQSVAAKVSDSFWTTALILAATSGIVSGLAYARHVKRIAEAEAGNHRCKALKGSKGNELVAIVDLLWQQLSVKGQDAPSIVWFASLNVLAHARDAGGRQEIQVSAGLWDRVVRKDSTATVILAHEMAHLVHRDSVVFRRLAAAVVATRAIMKVVGIFGCITFGMVFLQQLVAVIGDGLRLWVVAASLCSTAVMATLVLLFVPLSVMVVSRYVGFICSLVEVRADISAALWTGGLGSFAQTLASDSSIHHSTLRDRAQSMLSLNLTHISETERIDLLKSPARLATPKLRYFALSLVLPFLLPIGFLTPLLFGGAVNHILVAAPVAAFHFGLLSMIIVTAPALPTGLPWPRLFTLASGVCLASVLPHLNLELIGYLLAHLAISMTQPGGLGVGPTTWQSTLSDIALTLSDLSQKVVDALYSGWIIGAAALVSVCLWWLQMRASSIVAANWRRLWMAIVTAAAGAFLALLVSNDPFRDELFSFWPLSLAKPLARVTEDFRWLRSALPIMVGLACFELQSLILRFPPWRKSTSVASQ